jgi:hypothetical protein
MGTDETDTCPPEAYGGTVTREDRDSHQSLQGTVKYSLLCETIAITERQSPPKELCPFCHLTAVAGYRRDRVAGPSFVAEKPENTAGDFV